MILRKGRRARWATPTTAALDLTPRPVDNGELSVYDVESQESAARLSVLKGLTERSRPDDVDYVLISPEAFAALGLNLVQDAPQDIHPFVSERHRLVSIRDSATALALATEAIQRGATAQRITEEDLIAQAKTLIAADASLVSWVSPGPWHAVLGLS